MRKLLGLKASPLLFLCRLLTILLILGYWACLCASRIDFRTEAQKEAEYKSSLISSNTFQQGVEGIQAAKKIRIPTTTITKVTVFSAANLVRITYTLSGSSEHFYYNTKTDLESTENTFNTLLNQKISNYRAQQFYSGKTNITPLSFTVDYTDKDLQIMIKEATN